MCLLQLYGSLVGMFEYNNLALTVPGPVGRYKAMLGKPEAHGIAPDEAAAALQEVNPLLEALGDTADEPAEVSGLLLWLGWVAYRVCKRVEVVSTRQGHTIGQAALGGGPIGQLSDVIPLAIGALPWRCSVVSAMGSSCVWSPSSITYVGDMCIDPPCQSCNSFHRRHVLSVAVWVP